MTNIISINDITPNTKKKGLDWVNKEIDSNGNVKPLKTTDNFNIVMNKHNITIEHEEITGDVRIYFAGKQRVVNDPLLVLIKDKCVVDGLKMNKQEVFDNLKALAINEEYGNSFNGIKKALSNVELTKGNNIEELFSCFTFQEKYLQYESFFKSMFKKWLGNCLRLSTNSITHLEGYGNNVLILQGGQGLGKTTFVKSLMPEELQYLIKTGSSIDPSNKDSVIQNTGVLINELGEMDSTMKGEQAKLKAFFSETVDVFRSPFEATITKRARVTSFIGTVNKLDFLKDETGSRRFNIFPLEAINLEKLKEIDIMQVWKEIELILINNPSELAITQEDNMINEEINRGFQSQNDLSMDISMLFNLESDTTQFYSFSEFKKELSHELDEKVKSKQLKTVLMRNFGVEECDKMTKINGKVIRGFWFHKPLHGKMTNLFAMKTREEDRPF